MRKRATLGVVIVGLMVLAVSATATNGNNICESSEVCLYNDINFSGIEIDTTGNSPNWPFLGIENDDDSIKNRASSLHVVVYDNDSYIGSLYCADAGEWEDDINGTRDNKGDSHKWFSGSTCPIEIPHP